MPDAKTVEIADAVKTRLNLPSAFSQVITAVRAWTILYDLEELADLKVTVIATNSVTAEDAARSCRLVSHEIQVGVQKRVDVTSAAVMNTACDALAYLAEEIGNYFVSEAVQNSMDDEVDAKCLESSVVLCDPQMLREKHVFLSVITLGFAEWRDR